MSSLRDWRVTRMMFALLMAITVAGYAGMGAVSAQDASPEAAVCDSPGLPPGTPTAVEPAASPEAVEDMEGMDMGSPEAMEVPPAPVLPEGEPADAGEAGAITAAFENYAACYNEGQATGDPGLYVALESENYLLSRSGSANPYDRVANESGGPPSTVEFISVENPMTHDDGRVSADVEYVIGDHWFRHDRVLLSLGSNMRWLWDEEFYLRPQPDTETISVNGVNITETTDETTGEITYEFAFVTSSTLIEAEALIFNITNSGSEVHEAVVFQLPEGADPMGVLDGSIAFEDVIFYGALSPIFPGETKDLALLDLEPGAYTMICFIPGPDGAPHAANGMITQFEIVPAEA